MANAARYSDIDSKVTARSRGGCDVGIPRWR